MGEICYFSSFVVRLDEVEMENGCQIYFFQWRPTVLSKVVPPGRELASLDPCNMNEFKLLNMT